MSNNHEMPTVTLVILLILGSLFVVGLAASINSLLGVIVFALWFGIPLTRRYESFKRRQSEKLAEGAVKNKLIDTDDLLNMRKKTELEEERAKRSHENSVKDFQTQIEPRINDFFDKMRLLDPTCGPYRLNIPTGNDYSHYEVNKKGIWYVPFNGKPSLASGNVSYGNAIEVVTEALNRLLVEAARKTK